jgi:hypothetical protein
MAFLRFTRDKRGYEHFYLVQPSQRRGKSTARVLDWFRSPPNVKVGREPFDEKIRRELEAQNPGVSFDWRKILETPIPSADAEKWRERRRAERAAKAARRNESVTEVEADVDDAPDEVEEESTASEPDRPLHVLEAAADSLAATASNERADAQPDEQRPTPEAVVDLRPVGSGGTPGRKRRRRRRRRGSSPPPAGPAGDV